MALSGDDNSLLTVSIVTFGGDLPMLGPTLGALAAAAARLPGGRSELPLLLVDNGPYGFVRARALGDLLAGPGIHARVLTGHGNLGYGRGHNLAIAESGATYHLVLNPDVELAPDALTEALAFMDQYPECGLLAPAVRDEYGALQYLCKRLRRCSICCYVASRRSRCAGVSVRGSTATRCVT